MNIQIKGNEQVTQLLNEWYVEIRSRHLEKATNLKQQVGIKVNEIKESSELLQHYLLLDFRYNFLIDNLGVFKDSFNKIDSLGVPTNSSLAYYYHFFKAIHSNAIGEYNLAKEHYEKAEALLRHISDELEHAEFYYKLATFRYHVYQALLAITHVTKAKEIFSKYNGNELNLAFCNNLYGLACIHLREWELAEEHLTSAMDTFQKIDEKKFITMVKHNLGLMYGSQDHSAVAIRYLSEVIENSPNHYKAIFIKAREHFKLGETNIASELIEKGLDVCTSLGNKQYQYRFGILREMNKKVPAQELEKLILVGMDYFKKEQLWEYIQEYTEVVAVQYHNEGNFEQGSKYFYLSYEAKKEIHKKEALK
ncbi:histidine kinase [Bacillus gaemokensis]|uniref:Histidine kinase n=1 Tax=Bacillus gaemokensis TaxID=574375 RepID=A0A073KAF8_9BACI|nr:histidine kinase [Bacillus gaemokensis]KEK23545.1 histidine kinase [Bacillus gaemokensis]KYG26339.1 histidine kinase [Bacillus gaemokensis]